MSDFILCFSLTIKRYMKRKMFLLSILVLPILILFLGMLTEQSETEWKVALLSEEKGIAEAVSQRLMNKNGFICFYECESEDDMKKAIMSKQAECGVIFREGFQQAVETFHFDDEVILYYSPSSIAQKMVREEVFAATLAEVNETLLNNFMDKHVETADMKKEVLVNYYHQFVKDGNVFHFDYQEIEASQQEAGDMRIVLSPVRGMLAIFIWAELLLSVLLIYEDEKNGIYKVMRSGRRWLCQICILGIPAVLTSIATLLVLCFANNLYQMPILSIGEEILWLTGYSMLCIVFAMSLYYCCRNSAIYVLIVTVLLIAGVVICPVFFSLQMITPKLSRIQYLLMPGAYMCRFLTGQTWILWLEICIWAIVMVIMKLLNRKRFI